MVGIIGLAIVVALSVAIKVYFGFGLLVAFLSYSAAGLITILVVLIFSNILSPPEQQQYKFT